MILQAATIEGRFVRLREVCEEDLAALLRWYTDPEVTYWLHASERPPLTDEDVRARFSSEATPDNEARWIIAEQNGMPVGMTRLVEIDRHCGRAELAIAIGEKECWSRGYGTEAVRLVLGYAFNDLGLRRVYLITDADNGRGIRCYEKCGFRAEGLLRGHRTRYGEPLDMMIMGVLREEFEAEEVRGDR